MQPIPPIINRADEACDFLLQRGPETGYCLVAFGIVGPKRLATGMPSTARLMVNLLGRQCESLLNVSDLVFVNAIGTGYSQAIAPFSNSSF